MRTNMGLTSLDEGKLDAIERIIKALKELTAHAVVLVAFLFLLVGTSYFVYKKLEPGLNIVPAHAQETTEFFKRQDSYQQNIYNTLVMICQDARRRDKLDPAYCGVPVK